MSKWHKLDNITLGNVSQLVLQHPGVAIQDVHRRKVGGSDTDNDDGEGKSGCIHDGTYRVVYVGDDSVGYDQQDKVVLEKNPSTFMKVRFKKFRPGPSQGKLATGRLMQLKWKRTMKSAILLNCKLVNVPTTSYKLINCSIFQTNWMQFI